MKSLSMNSLSVIILCLLVISPAYARKHQDRWEGWSDWSLRNQAEHPHNYNANESADDDSDADASSGRAERWAQYRQQLLEHKSRITEAQEQHQADVESENTQRTGRRRGRFANHTFLQSHSSGVCDVLADATPGLQRLCVAFCDMQDCEADFSLENPFENCRRGSSKVYARYETKRGAGDPDMPCIKQPEVETACPCWTGDELAALRSVDEFSSGMCFTDASSADGSLVNMDSWRIVSNSSSLLLYFTAISSVEQSAPDGNPACSISNYTCPDGVCPETRSMSLEVTPTQFAACEMDVMFSAANRSIDCQPL